MNNNFSPNDPNYQFRQNYTNATSPPPPQFPPMPTQFPPNSFGQNQIPFQNISSNPQQQSPQEFQINMGMKDAPTPAPIKTVSVFWRVLAVLMLIASATFLVIYLNNIFAKKGVKYATVKTARVGQTYQGNVLLVRDETVYDDDGVTDVQYIANENSYISRTNVVCYVFTSGYSSKEKRTLQNYRDQIKNYQINLLNTESTFDQKMDRLVADVNSRALEVRSVVQGGNGNMFNLESVLTNSIDSRQKYFEEKYAEDQSLSRLYDDETTQLKRIESWKKQSHASFDGIVSFYTDGYEYGLNTKNFENLSPVEVERMIAGQKPEEAVARRGKTDIFRIVKQSDWYALMVIEDSTWNPVQGTTLMLTLEQFSNTTVEATISSFARTGNKLLLRLRISANVEPVLYIRSCSAQIGEYSDAMSVPEKALYTHNESLGVVIISGTKTYFVPVELISKANGEAYVKPKFVNTLHSGDTVLLN